jgi:hypothetical protein
MPPWLTNGCAFVLAIGAIFAAGRYAARDPQHKAQVPWTYPSTERVYPNGDSTTASPVIESQKPPSVERTSKTDAEKTVAGQHPKPTQKPAFVAARLSRDP